MGVRIASICIRKDARALGETEQRLYVLTRGRRRGFTPTANALRTRLLTQSPGSREVMCPTQSSSAHKRTSSEQELIALGLP